MSTLRVLVPQFLSHLVDEKQEVDVEVDTMNELKDFFRTSYTEFSERIWNEEGNLKRNVLLVLNDELIKVDSQHTEFVSGDELSIILQFAGG